MHKKNLVMNCITLLSAFLFSLAFIFINSCGFLVIPALLLLGLLFCKPLIYSSYNAAYAGFIWGGVVFGIHFLWFLKLLLTKSHANGVAAGGLYGFLILYLALTSLVWFLVTFFCCTCVGARPEEVRSTVSKDTSTRNKRIRALIRLLFFIITTSYYFTFLNHYSFWFLGSQEGYPFLSPCIPLASYDWFLELIAQERTCSILPQAVFIKPTSYKDDEKKAAYDIFHTLARVVTAHDALYLAPESTYPYALNHKKESVRLWSYFLPPGSNFLLGAHYSKGEHTYQAIYWLQSGRIKDFYVKKHTVPLVEKIPPYFKKYNSLKNIFIQKNKEFSVGTENKLFKLSPTCVVFPLVCSEFFFKTNTSEIVLMKRKYADCQLMIFLFINDSWFVDYFKKIMENVTYLKAVEFGLPILLITHTECKKIIPLLSRKESKCTFI